MKISEVPQDDIKTLNGVKKALYAIDDQGCYAKTTTGGWEAEEVVLNQVIGDFDEKARETASRVRNNETSPIEYFLSLIHISEPTRLGMISYAVFCLKKKK